MPNVIYPKWKEALISGASNAALSGTVRVALVDLGAYTYSAAHEFLSSLGSARVGADQTLTGKTFVNGTFDADDAVFPAVTGPTVEALVIYVDTGNAATSRLVAFFDDVTGFTFTPNGGALNLTFSASGIFRLGA